RIGRRVLRLPPADHVNEVFPELYGAAIARTGVLGETTADDAAQGCWNMRRELGCRFVHDRLHRLPFTLSVKGRSARQHGEKERAQAKNIRAAVCSPSGNLFRRHIVRRALDRARQRSRETQRLVVRGALAASNEFGQAEIKELDSSVSHEDKIGG